MLIASTPALARIGETPEQCQARYGEPVKKLSNNRSLFQKNGILIIAEFYEGEGRSAYLQEGRSEHNWDSG